MFDLEPTLFSDEINLTERKIERKILKFASKMDIAEMKSDSMYSLDQGIVCYTQSNSIPQPFDIPRSFIYSNSFPNSPRLSPPTSMNESFGSTSSVSFGQDSSPETSAQMDLVVSNQPYDYNDDHALWKQQYLNMGGQKHENQNMVCQIPIHDQIHQPVMIRICLVCNDSASGQHYGVPSCEACKAFFKRTVQGAIEYTCPANNECPITKRRRKACQACRFQKCIRVGMLREGVRLDRVRGGRQKYRRAIRNDVAENSINNRSTEVQSIVTQLLQAERKVSPSFKNVKTEIISDNLMQFGVSVRDRLLNLISWAKAVPGFSDMSLPTQTQALRNGWLDALALDFAFYSQPATSTINQQYRIVLSNHFVLNNETCRNLGLPKLYESSRKLLLALSSVKLSSGEFVLMKALFLFSTHEPVDSKAKNLGNRVMRMFADYAQLGPNENDDNRYGSLLLLSAFVRELALNLKEALLIAQCSDPLVNELLRPNETITI